ncbi:MAG: hypothetical protein BGO10_01375 [Chlamydia sp. 32-24]|nr:MAG: hypothetical protein BGO10_01375 [Chlamydia sp. 32-24]
MTDLPLAILKVFAIFTPLFSRSVFKNALQLFLGHVLCKNRRTITEILRQLGLKNIKNYSKYHWVFSGAKWCSFQGSKILLLNLGKICSKNIVISIDSTIERRKGPNIKGLGRQRDAVQSTKENKVLVIGLNWLVCAIHIQFPWASKIWACPFLSVLMPPKNPLSSSKNKSDLKKLKRHKTLNEWACQIVRIISKWIGKIKGITIVADSAFATYILANTCIDNTVSLISRMRLDARTFNFPIINKNGRPRLVGKRLPTFEQLAKDLSQVWQKINVKWYGETNKEVEVLTGLCLWYGYGIRPVPIKWVLIKIDKEYTVLFSTNLNHTPEYIIETFVERWQLESTFEECRRHLGIETQRQWSDKSIDRTTPCLFASYSVINLMALELTKDKNEEIPIQECSWYKKKRPTFSDVLNYLRLEILKTKYFSKFSKKVDLGKSPLYELVSLLAAA